MRKSYKIILMVISILLIGSIIIGTSYSMWVKTAVQKEENIVNSSCFDIEFTESSSINLASAIPISDEAGLKKKPYTFTLKNTCNMNSKVTIALDVLSTSTMSSSAIKTSLTKGNKSGTPALLTSLDKKAEVDISGAKETYILGTDIIGANKSKSYSLYLWMDESVTVAEASKSFSSKVVIVNTATEEEPPLTLAEKVADLAATDTANFATDDPDNNIRYIGANPNNYVYFNCSDYSNQSDSTCEKWRIIGVFKNMTKEDGSKEDLVKIIRDDRLSNAIFYWDFKKNGVGTSTMDYGSNDWTDSQLMMMLNPTDYLKSGYTIDNNIVKDSKGQAIYQNMGSYYNGTSGCQPAAAASGADFTCTSIDFTSTGLKNDSARNAIESVVWNLGGTSSYSLAASDWYGYERGTTVYSGHATTWTGKIGLMYPSDYGYATAGGATTNRAACLAKELFYWIGSDVSDCKNNDYLYKSGYIQWTLTPSSSNSSSAFFADATGLVGNSSVNGTYGVRPAAFLKSNISITGVGIGTVESPFQLKVG